MRYLYLSLILVLIFVSCQSGTESEGEILAKKKCASCHKFPDPSLLDKKTWKEGVLPEMSLRLGLGDRFALLTRISEEQYNSAVQMDIYPSTAKLSQEEFNLIEAYYLKNAPEKPLPQKKRSSISTDPLHFKIGSFISKTDGLGSVTSIRIHPQKKETWVGTRSNKLWIIDSEMKLKSTQVNISPIVLTQFKGNKTYLLAIGKMHPNDEKLGNLLLVSKKGEFKSIADSLKRPVDIQISDFNGDHVDDYIICEFGYEQGQLVLIDGKSGKRSILKMQAGARNVVIKDYTKDGKPDLMVLFGQSREGVSLFINKGQGSFVEKPILQFDSVFGSSFMEVADMNKDGYDDIIISNGDNADYSRSKKAYHGVHLFLNDGRNNFKEKYFYPAYGASKTVARDFDQDGDLDLAMIAFFAENDKGKVETFLYFQNQGSLQFKVSNLNIPAGGKYIVMDAADMDKDGDIDIILGNYLYDVVKPIGKITPGLQLTYFKNLIH